MKTNNLTYTIEKEIQTTQQNLNLIKNQSTSNQQTTSSHLQKAQPYLSQTLISTKNFSNIHQISQIFPSNLTSFLGFECHLGEIKPRADLAFAISGIGHDRHVFTQLLSEGNFPQSLLETPEWKRITNFAKMWSEETSELKNKIQCLWLEFDIPDEQNPIPIPSIFFGPTKHYSNPKQNDITHLQKLTETTISILKGKKISSQIKQKITQCLKKMPSNTSLFQIGTMISRDNQLIRFHINKIKPDQIIPYLKQIGYKQKTQELETIIHEIQNKADRFVLSYDITENGIGPRIGIELSYHSNHYQDEQRWDDLLQYLVNKGICLQEKKEALLNYTGTEQNQDFTGAILQPIKTTAEYLSEPNLCTTIRYINHIKIAYNPNGTIEAKAYPAVRLFKNKQ